MVDVLKKYTDYLRYEKNYSDYTINSYKSDIIEYFEYLNRENKANRQKLVEKGSGFLSAYKNPSKIGKEREFYIQGLMKKYGK